MATPASAAGRRPRRLWLLALVLLGAIGLSGPARPLIGMARLASSPDVPALLAGLELRPGLTAVPPALLRAAPDGVDESGGAHRFLAAMSGALAEGWGDPAALHRMLLARVDLPSLQGAALQPLETVRSVQPLGWKTVRLEIGPLEGPPGLRLDLAWRGGGWRLDRLEILVPPPAAG